MKRFRASELVFILIGLLLIIGSAFLLRSNVSLVRIFNLHLKPGDPFEASYYVGSETQARPTPTPIVTESNKLSLYLVSPTNQAILSRSNPTQNSENILFKFEVYPKNTGVILELLAKNKIIQSINVPPNSTGTHEITLKIPGPGLYQWRVKHDEIMSELRNFVLR